jgi:hypothetical protein
VKFWIGFTVGGVLAVVIDWFLRMDHESHAVALLIRWRSSQGWKFPQTRVEQEADELIKKSGHEPGKDPDA